MALPTTGVHVSCHLLGGTDSANRSTLALLGPCLWSETLAPNTVTTNAAPESQNTAFVVKALGESWIAIGSEPRASVATGNRRAMYAGDDHTQIARAGEKVGCAST